MKETSLLCVPAQSFTLLLHSFCDIADESYFFHLLFVVSKSTTLSYKEKQARFTKRCYIDEKKHALVPAKVALINRPMDY